MPLTKVWIENGCISCGLCEAVCADVFVLEDVAKVKEDVNVADYEAKIKEAADICPVQVIKFE